MEAAGTFFILFGLGLIILQIVMIVKFFQIASDFKAIKEHSVIGNSLDELKRNIELWKYLGHSDKVRETLIMERVKREDEE